jgi:pimeloyl-ACP methyl ester carboxylesterase/DNA-binding winged helix-turn-helix (wHTH) protein/class 3 adenylate cyclase
MPAERRFKFEGFQLDLGSGRLSGDAGPIAIAPKALAVLEYLAARPGQLVSKDELLSAIWPGVFLGDSALKVCVSEIRRALGDDAKSPRIIETAHRRGYRFIAPVTDSPPVTASPAGSSYLPAPAVLPVHYARSGDVNIAYQVLGSGPIDLLFVMGWVSHLEYFWNEPSFARFLRRLASFSRLILFDKRGTGLSDRVAYLPTLEERMDDVRAVLNAVGSRRAVLLGVSEGGPMCGLFAATHPDKTEALIMVGTYARRLRAPDYPWAPTQEEREAFCREILERWGGPVGIEARAPSVAGDRAFRDWWATYLRMGASPAAAVALTRMNAQIDVRHVLPTIKVPTLVMHRTGDRCLSVEEGRYVASLIPGAHFVELPGDDHLPFVGDQDGLLNQIEQFLTDTTARAEAREVLATILCATVHGASQAPPDADVDRLHAIVAEETQHFSGTDTQRAGDRIFAAFDGPARAIRCGQVLVARGAREGLPLRVGLHTGECDRLDGPGQGLVAGIAARVAALGRPGDVLVSRTVVDLVAGSGLEVTDRGMHALTDGQKARRIFAVAEHGTTRTATDEHGPESTRNDTEERG